MTAPTLFFASQNITWGRGFKIFFGGQIFSGIMMLIFTGPFSLLSYGILRKVNQHAFLNPSVPILDSSIPEKHRFLIKNHQETWSQLIGYTTLALVTSVTIYTSLGNSFLWASMVLIGCAGFYYRAKVMKNLNEFQLSYIVRCNIYEAVSAFMSLANSESSQHYRALVNLLKQRPRPIISKAIIFSLGRMRKVEAIPSLLEFYKETDREDIQQVIIEALLNFKSYEIDRFFKDTLHDMINNQVKLGSMRMAVFRSLSKRIKHLAILTLLEELEYNKNNDKELANTVRLIGDIAVRFNDKLLLSYLPQYLDDKYSRRIRINTILNLYRSKKYSALAKEHLDVFLTSANPDDRSAVAFIAGELKLRGLISFVLKNSEDCQHKNSTLLISLMKLGHNTAAKWFVELMLEAKEDTIMVALNQLSLIEDYEIRYEVYAELIYNHPDKIQFFLAELRHTKRNFDEDRKVIHLEASKIGYQIQEEDWGFSSSKTEDILIKKTAA